MGIDVYMSWAEKTQEDHVKQLTGFEVSGRAGGVGYLREAYHGGPYATKVLVRECWEQPQPRGGLPFPAKILQERLPEAIDTAIVRYRRVYNTDDHHEMTEALTAFVELAEKKERETGSPVTVYASY